MELLAELNFTVFGFPKYSQPVLIVEACDRD